MASPQYNDRTLAAQEAKRKLGVTLEDPQPAPGASQDDSYTPDRFSVDRLLQDAYEALERADQLEEETGSPALAGMEDRMAQLSAGGDKRGTLRKLTDAGVWMAGPAAAASMVPSPVQPFAAGAAALAGGASGLRRLLMPEEDESRAGGAIEAGLSALPYALPKGLAALRGLVGKEAAAPRMSGPRFSSERPYRMGEPENMSNFPKTSAPAPAVEPPTQFWDEAPEAAWRRLPTNPAGAPATLAELPRPSAKWSPFPEGVESTPQAPITSPSRPFSKFPDADELLSQTPAQQSAVTPGLTGPLEFEAANELARPGAQRFMNREFSENNPIAQRVLGRERVGGPEYTPEELSVLPESWQQFASETPPPLPRSHRKTAGSVEKLAELSKKRATTGHEQKTPRSTGYQKKSKKS